MNHDRTSNSDGLEDRIKQELADEGGPDGSEGKDEQVDIPAGVGVVSSGSNSSRELICSGIFLMSYMLRVRKIHFQV